MIKKFKIIGEAHSGVFSVDEEHITTIEGENESDALSRFSQLDNRVRYSKEWNRYLIGARRIFAIEADHD